MKVEKLLAKALELCFLVGNSRVVQSLEVLVDAYSDLKLSS